MQITRAVELSNFALRLFATIANSVAPEQAFSSMNHIHTKASNGLGVDKLRMLMYIYINQRKLDQMGFHNAWFDDWLDANESEEQDVVAFENHTAWSEYEVEMQAQLQRQREIEAVEEFRNISLVGKGNRKHGIRGCNRAETSEQHAANRGSDRGKTSRQHAATRRMQLGGNQQVTRC